MDISFYNKGELLMNNHIKFKKLISLKGKEFDEIHSGNENEIKLPIKLPKFSFLRKEIVKGE